MHLKPAALVRHGLPDIAYPMTTNLFASALDGGLGLPFADMLHLLQERSAQGDADWRALEPAIDRLAELIAPSDDRALVSAGGPEWWIEIGPVNLRRPIVTVQRGHELVAAMRRRRDGGLRLAAYRPLDARSTRLITAISLRPHHENGTVCMRDNNWEYALDCSAGMGQHHAYERGEANLFYWQNGIGREQGGTANPHWWAMRRLAPRPSSRVATELGVAYAFSGVA